MFVLSYFHPEMKTRQFILFLNLLLCIGLSAGNRLDSILSVLDNTIENNLVYTRLRENRIDSLKDKLSLSTELQSTYNLQTELYKEYKSYKCDSAIRYLNRNMEIALQLNDNRKLLESKLRFTHLLAATGMYMEAKDLLATIPRNTLPPDLVVDYYLSTELLYKEAAGITQDSVFARQYTRMAGRYGDSIFNSIDSTGTMYFQMAETRARVNGEYDKALRINDKRLSETTFGTAEYALVTYYRSLIYRDLHQKEDEKYYLALSSISDIRSAIKDHASLWMLAQLLYQEGDIERAYRYIRFSWNETVFYNARLRSLQTAGILSLIEDTYHALIQQKNRELEFYILSVSALGILLAIALLFIYRQMKKLAVARNNLQQVNGQLKVLNEELSQMNTCLTSTNTELSESNQIKEQYIGRFINLCSTYINKLDAYRRMVNKKLSTGNADELQKITRSPNALDNELEELYLNFDKAFLQLFPDFVDEFNHLLLKEERIIPRNGELLNTELRIFALIRLGINDSSQIAEFLRYSVNTIYNYRAKVKNKACVSRENFEELVMKIK